MAADKPTKTNPFDPQALLEAQRRNFDAFTNASQIVADGMRTYAERHVSMVQEAMSGLWSELQASTRKPATSTAAPTEQLDRMRVAFEKVMAQVQELSTLLLKVQSEAIAVLNECAAKNFQTLGGAAPEFAELQNRAKQAFEAATQQTMVVIDEMKKRMASLEAETRSATQTATEPAAASASESSAARKSPPAASSDRAKRTSSSKRTT
jgi:Phasin protein